jgi:hypothetical protein
MYQEEMAWISTLSNVTLSSTPWSKSSRMKKDMFVASVVRDESYGVRITSVAFRFVEPLCSRWRVVVRCFHFRESAS